MSEMILKEVSGLKTSIDSLNADTKKKVDLVMEAVKAAQDKADEATREAKSHGSSFGETIEKVKEIGATLADLLKSTQDNNNEIKTKQKALEDAIEKLAAKKKMGHNGGPSLDDDGVRKHLAQFLKTRHFGETADGTEVEKDFNEAGVTQDALDGYEKAKSTFWKKAFRARTSATLQNELSSEEWKALNPLHMQKTISTISHGNRFWLMNEFSDRVIQCYDTVSDLSFLFDSMWISRGGVEMMVDNDLNKRALFKCEMNCAPGNAGAAPAQPGTIAIPVHEMYDTHCITHTMLDDAEIDLEGWLVPRVSEGFSRGRNETFLWGDGNGKPTGLMRPGKHLEMTMTPIGGSSPGAITWQHLRIMPFQLPKRFQSNGSYIMSRDALMSLFTMADGHGKPMVDGWLAVGADGLMRLWGYPVFQIDQLANYLDTASPPAPVTGSKPVGFGSWADAYLIVNRLGFFVLRDPAYNPCGVTWHFGMRVGGDVLCPNASVFLKVA